MCVDGNIAIVNLVDQSGSESLIGFEFESFVDLFNAFESEQLNYIPFDFHLIVRKKTENWKT